MHFFAKKSLGQNFLKSKAALLSIISAGSISTDDVILEIGPGEGVLTEKLLEQAQKVIAVEKDDRLISFLTEKFHTALQEKKLELIHADILEFDPANLKKYASRYKLIANIPYYITGALLRKFLSGNFQPETMVILIQKEVAKRIVARKEQGEKESLLSISVKVYGTPKYIETVKAKYFSPAPNVDSAILLIENISKKNFQEHILDENLFFTVLRAGFAHKRKVLLNNLKIIFPEINLEGIFAEISLSPKIRAEDLTLDDWKKLVEKLPR